MRALSWLSLLIAPFALADAGPAVAQTMIGVKGGIAYAHPSIESFGSEARAGALTGGFVSFPVVERVVVQVEVQYAERGFSTFGFRTEGAGARTPYLDFPILLKAALVDEANAVRPAVFAGGFWGTELSCTTDGDIVEVEESDSCTGRFRGRGTADVGLILGGGVDIDVGERWFVLADTRVQLGVRNLHLDPESGTSKSRTWSLVGGIGYRLGS